MQRIVEAYERFDDRLSDGPSGNNSYPRDKHRDA
ncbi:PhoH-like protein [Pseudomonas syringae pv. pisi str. 1704B]|uniref:PhoH-like protein n=1 Tax=Pseudomonas syringae pv. pisi str. 1704B TaxID=629263 RepID=F3GI75_PSESJ|nr:PhoH-like protein [Pseudomonas syringae pv. pisi str. 1704B]